METREKVIDILNDIKEVGQNRVNQFKAEFNNDPSHALIWAESVFESQAKVEVVSYLLERISRCEISIFYASLTKEVLERAQYRNGSTSTTSNLYQEFKTNAYAKILDRIS